MNIEIALNLIKILTIVFLSDAALGILGLFISEYIHTLPDWIPSALVIVLAIILGMMIFVAVWMMGYCISIRKC